MTKLAERSPHGPALAGTDTQALLAWTGTDGHLNTAWGTDGVTFPNKRTDDTNTSIDGPACAAFGGFYWLAWTGTDGAHSLNVMMAQPGDGASGMFNWNTVGESSAAGPAVAFLGGVLHLAWVGTDGRLNVRWAAQGDPSDFPAQNKVTLDERSAARPALAAVPAEQGGADRLYLGWTGTDGRLNLRWSAGGGAWPDGSKRTLPETSGAGPALYGAQGTLRLAWTGADRRLNSLVFDRPNSANLNATQPKSTFGETSAVGPAVARVLREGWVAWAGTDDPRSLNVARIAGLR